MTILTSRSINTCRRTPDSGSRYSSLEKSIREVEGMVDTRRHDAKVRHLKVSAKAQEFSAATIRAQELESQISLLADHNRSLSQQVETMGLKERALLEKLTEKSKALDDLTRRHDSLRATFQCEWFSCSQCVCCGSGGEYAVESSD